MYQTMEIYMARKKQVPEHYNPDSNRIFDNGISDDSLGDSRMNKLHIERKNPPPPPHPREPERRNCPHPWHSRFLRHNVKLLNEPVCVMATENTDPEQHQWWPSRTSEKPLMKPNHTLNTTQRSDYQHSAPVRGSTRHSSNPYPSTLLTKGILPVNIPRTKEDPGDVLLERISYIHDYNSRLDRNEPIRGKLHGSYVWNEVAETEDGKVVVTPWNRKALHRCVTVPVAKQDLVKINAAPSDEKKRDKKVETACKEEKDAIKPEARKENDPKQVKFEDNAVKTVGEKVPENPTKKLEAIPPIDGLPAPTGA